MNRRHGVVALRLGSHAIAARNLANLHAAGIGGIARNQLVQKPAQNAADFAIAQADLAFGFGLGIE